MPKKKLFDIDYVDRVVINLEGEAVPVRRAKEECGISPDIIFIRNDGWTLGAQNSHRQIAFKMWANEWTHFYNIGDRTIRPIAEYKS